MPTDDLRYKGGLVIFPGSDGLFDKTVCDFARKLILELIREVDNPTKIAVGEHIGVLRERVTRILESLGLEDEYIAIKNQRREDRISELRAKWARKRVTVAQNLHSPEVCETITHSE